MSGYGFAARPELPALPGWRALDRALAHWTLAHGGSLELALLAGWASHAEGLGDTALAVDLAAAGREGWPRLDAAAIAELRRQPLLGDGGRPTPFVLDPEGRFYLWRNFADEVAVAAHVRARCAPAAPAGLPDADLERLFAGGRPEWDAAQRRAVAAAVGARLFVLTGGPGTGKTSTVLRMLLALQRAAGARALTIQVAAPTGKAAQRLVQSLRQGKQTLLRGLPADWQPLLAAIPEREAPTVHRLLGYDPRRNLFARDRSHPLAADVVVVDEASMLDLSMLRALFEALPAAARLILVGDADQLGSVGAGSVLRDLVAALEAAGGARLVRLDRSFRAERQLAAIAAAAGRGDGPALARAFDAAGAQAQWRKVETVAGLQHALAQWAQALAGALDRFIPAADPEPGAPEPSPDPAAGHALRALHRLGERQLLCALREDAFGALTANAMIEGHLKRLWGIPAAQRWYPGRAVLITRNDYAAGLYNGDVGLTLAEPGGALWVWFESRAADGSAGARRFAPNALPDHQGAFAVTIHKSQGSEYRHVAVLLPPDPRNPILLRPLLYTGLSRARHSLELWSAEASLEIALATAAQRSGGLAARLVAMGGLEPPTPAL